MTNDTRGSRQAEDVIELLRAIRADASAYHWHHAIDKALLTRQPQEEKGWRTIDSAPKDGRFLLLVVVPQLPSNAEPYVTIGQFFNQGINGGWWASHALHVHPTHWQPLPDPPSRPHAQEQTK